MAASTVSPSTPEIRRACDAIDEAIVAYLKAAAEVNAYLQYESTAESMNVFALTIRHVEATLALARTDLVLFPAACALARAALETAAKAAWIVDDNDPFNRELRWLVHLQEEERFYERVAKRDEIEGVDPRAMRDRAERIKCFRSAVTAKLPVGYIPLSKNPKVDELLASLGLEVLYTRYNYLSQFVHGTHAATWIYRSEGLGTEKRPGEKKQASDWYLPLSVCLGSLLRPGSRLLWRIGNPSKTFLAQRQMNILIDSVERIRRNAAKITH